jgi:phosphoglycolate phosphatase-like HAD superfamily hydrolase
VYKFAAAFFAQRERDSVMTAHRPYTQQDLTGLKPRFRFFVGIDSDGCVFPTMEIKQKQCFHPIIIAHWHLEKIEKPLRQAAEFANLYSKWRGTNRFIALLKTFDLLRLHPAVKASGVAVPELPSLRRFVASGAPLGNPEMEKAARDTGDAELADVLRWSQDINAFIAQHVKNVPPFKWVRESLAKIAQTADAICVSQTPTEALVREWDEHGITRYISAIAGQELGTKAEHIALATQGRYVPDNILMIGDAPGDLRAAEANKALFFPICPGHEEASWERFGQEAYDRFLHGTFRGAYQSKLTAEFEQLLPEKAPWEQ